MFSIRFLSFKITAESAQLGPSDIFTRQRQSDQVWKEVMKETFIQFCVET